ncbi:MAG: pirin family protein [archaeon]
MKTKIFPSAWRGSADYGWLKTSYSFSFGEYHNPARMGFGALRALNDDSVDAAKGFDLHPHDNMEIVTIVLEGALLHSDSMGNRGVIPAGDVQRMSAGTGIAHSEANASKKEPVKLFQIWIYPKERNIGPSYEQKSFAGLQKNKFTQIVSPDGKNGSLRINQDAGFLLGEFDAGKDVSFKPENTEHGVFVFVVSGKVFVGKEKLAERDSAEITGAKEIKITALEKSKILIIEVPME